ncbi:MAG TPA: ABC transporter permease [Mesorhizobium sp.]|jgi:ribose transport system permease protein|nr:ABC transporter permease [Mesorhizobium sp.]
MTTIGTTTPQPAAPARDRAAGRAAALRFLSRYGTLIVFALLVLFNILFTPNFLEWRTLLLNLTQVSTVVIVAMGMTLVIATGGIDLSVGSIMAIAGALAPLIFLDSIYPIESQGLAIALAFVVPLIVAGCFGWFNGFLITRFNIQPIVATLVLFIAGRGIAQTFTNSQLQTFNEPTFQFIGKGAVFGIPTQVLVMAVVVAATVFLVRSTALGRQILAVGGNEKAARLSGINAARVKRLVYVVSGVLAGLSGLIVVAINNASDAARVGSLMELDAIAAVAVGGTLLSGGRANVLGTVLGAFVLQLVRTTLLANGVPDAAALVVKAGLIIAAVWLQGRAERTA